MDEPMHWRTSPRPVLILALLYELAACEGGLFAPSSSDPPIRTSADEYVLETTSVLLQMSWFKLTRRFTGTGRRIFRITPIHHHFEHLGWDEVTVDDVMAGSSRANRRTMPEAGRLG